MTEGELLHLFGGETNGSLSLPKEMIVVKKRDVRNWQQKIYKDLRIEGGTR